ncbi:uncharacterized protein [Dermacentor albipictus]|uniref:uncharacterized protein isoform X2 n=1 Tax=Dermacentor albipictus TaxID=60249 RepID=UPI0038FD0F69
MGFFTVLALCTLAVANGFEAPPFEEDPRFAWWQDVKAMTSITERMYIVSRNYNITTRNRCHSAIKTAALRHDTIVVALRTHLGGVDGPPQEFKSVFTTSRTGTHRRDNAVIYKLHPSCQLLMTESAIDYPVPKLCMLLYHNYCPGPKVLLYQPECKIQDAFLAHKASAGRQIQY